MLSGSSPHRTLCHLTVTVCVIALQHIIAIALLLQNGTSITLQKNRGQGTDEFLDRD